MLFVILMISTAAYTERVFGPKDGFKAPLFSLGQDGDDEHSISLSDYQGRYLVLTFWSSTDPASRLDCHKYDRYAANASVEWLAVNFDPSEGVYRQVVTYDGLDVTAQHRVSGAHAAKLKADYELDSGYKTLLIDPDGDIVAVNPSKATIDEMTALSR